MKREESFRKALEELYQDIKSCVSELDFEINEKEMEIYEERSGSYKVKEFFAYLDDEFVFKVKPVGAFIIAADGRADLIGEMDTKNLVYLKRSRSISIKATLSLGSETRIRSSRYRLH